MVGAQHPDAVGMLRPPTRLRAIERVLASTYPFAKIDLLLVGE